jgi:AraC-like DNA-binding protein
LVTGIVDPQVTGREPRTCPYRGLAPPPDLREHLLCAWTVGPASGGTETVLPDGSIDIVWPEGQGPIVAGPDTGAVPSTRPPSSTVVGASFHPGAAPAMLGIPADRLRDLRVPLSEVWGRDAERLEASLNGAGSASARLKLLGHELRRRLKHAERPDQLVAAAVARLRNPQSGSVSAIAGELGISERQLRRRFHTTVGYGPKTLARVLRFQRMLALARQRSSRDLGELAIDAGYADQAHMTTECTHLAGLPPGRLIAERYPL